MTDEGYLGLNIMPKALNQGTGIEDMIFTI